MNNIVYGQAMENVKNGIDVKNKTKTTKKKKNNICNKTPKPRYMSQKLFDKDVVAIRKSKVTLDLKNQIRLNSCNLSNWEIY